MHSQRAEDEGGSCSNLKEEAQEVAVKEQEKDRGGVPGIDCSVCFTRPVQV